jgi:hypothetical protein
VELVCKSLCHIEPSAQNHRALHTASVGGPGSPGTPDAGFIISESSSRSTRMVNRQLIVGSVARLTNRDGVEAPVRIVAQVGVADGALVYGVEFVLGRQSDF